MTIQLLLSSEIGPFEDQQTDFLENSTKILDFAQIPYVNYIGNLSKMEDFEENSSAGLQMDLSQSSRGVGWSSDYCE